MALDLQVVASILVGVWVFWTRRCIPEHERPPSPWHLLKTYMLLVLGYYLILAVRDMTGVRLHIELILTIGLHCSRNISFRIQGHQ